MGISEDRLHHILGVARKAYKIALERGHDEAFAKKIKVIEQSISIISAYFAFLSLS